MRHALQRHLYGWAVRCGWMGLAAEVLARLTRVERPGRRYRVLCLSKTVFSLDLQAVMAHSHELTFLLFPRLLLSDIVRRHVDDFEALNDASYYPRLDGTPGQQRIRADMGVVFGRLRRRLRFDAVLAGSFVYVSQQELFRVASAAGVPVVVLYKEGMIPKEKHAYAGSQLYQTKQFHASRILFYNEYIRDMLLTAGVPGLEPAQTAVVGVPRFDALSGHSRQAPSAPHVVLFAFSPEEKAAYLVRDRSRHPAFIARVAAFQADFVRYAAERPSVRVTIKTKSADLARANVVRLLAERGWDVLPANVTVVSTGDAANFLRQATAVAGYTSTTLLESLTLGVPVICPELKDILPDEPFDYFREAPEAVTRVSGYSGLRDALDAPDRLAVPDADARERVLAPLIYRTDGRASERVETELVAEIARAGAGR